MQKSILILIVFLLAGFPCLGAEQWTIETQEDWQSATAASQNLKLESGHLHPQADSASFSSNLKKFQNEQKLQSVTFRQAPNWNTWKAIPKVTPKGVQDAPIFVPVAPGNYWFLARKKGDKKNGYHAWHSENMKTWQHHGPISTYINRWVTTAEYVDGKFYIYFDKPNDEDPHLIIDDDLTDGKQGKEIGMVFNDPSHGSDMAILRDNDGTFHLIYEDWDPINARSHSWDSPLAGHATSPDGINGFESGKLAPAIDVRSKPTGEYGFYIHGTTGEKYKYEIHEGPQDAFGDYTMIKVGKQYYLFCDYDPCQKGKTMRVGRWRSDDIMKEFVWDGEIGENFHPDPTVGFAEGKFYLLVQHNGNDFISDGPWVDGIEARAGVDTNNDGNIDQWTEFTKIKESYSQKKGFVRVVEAAPATLDTSTLKAGFAFKIEFRTQITSGFQPVIDAVECTFE